MKDKEDSSSSLFIEFDKIGFVGRKEEVEKLKTCVEKATSDMFEISPNMADTSSESLTMAAAITKTNHDDGESGGESSSGPLLVLVSGFSGVGKTSLISEAIRQAEEKNEDEATRTRRKEICPSFGKFEQLKREPLAALDVIICSLCNYISSSEDDKVHQLRQFLKTSNMELDFVSNLINAFPVVSRFFDEEGAEAMHHGTGSTTRSEEEKGKSYDSSLDRLKYAFRVFVKALCAVVGPIALVLDDVQWGDSSSLELVRALVSDSSLSGLVVIVSYRDNEIEPSDPVAMELRLLERDAGSSRLTKIQLGNHTRDELNVLFAQLLKMEEKDVETLTDVVFLKTHGNVFYSLQLLRFLVENEIVYNSPRWLQWEWDVMEIQRQASVSENVVYLVVQKIRSLPVDTRSIIQLASCLGARFDMSTVFELQNIILRERGSPLVNSETMERTKKELLEQMLILRVRRQRQTMDKEHHNDDESSKMFRFGHDIIQHAAYSTLTENNDHEWIHIRIGSFFRDRCSVGDQQQQDHVIAAASHLNLGAQIIEGDIDELTKAAQTNLEAARLTKALSAFSSSLSFVTSGLDQIPGERWRDPYYDLTLGLYVLKCELLYCLGKFDECLEVIGEIETEARTVNDKGGAVLARIQIHGNRYELDVAIEHGLSLLRDLGENFPTRPSYLRVVYSILVTQNALSGRSYASVLDVPTMTDKSALLVQKTVSILSHYVFLAQNPNLVVAMNLRLLRHSLKYGISKYTSYSIAAWGYVLSTMGKFEEAFWWGHTAIEMQTRFNDYAVKTSTAAVVYPFLYHLRRPMIQDVVKPMLSVYTQGMRNGDLQFATAAANHYVQFYVYIGLPLSLLSMDLASLIDRAKSHGQRLSLETRTMQVCYQTVLNLRGKNENTLRLSGIAMQEEELVASITSSTTSNGGGEDNKDGVLNPYLLLQYQFLKFLLHYVLGAYESAFDIACACSDGQSMRHRKQDAAAFYIGEFGFHSGLVGLMEMRGPRRENKRKALRIAQTWLRFLENWVDRGVVHAEHKVLLLRAEMMRSTTTLDDDNNNKKGNAPSVVSNIASTYEQAIESAWNAGFVLATAIASERAAEFYFDTSQTELAHSRLQFSYAQYLKWEATTKTDLMVEKYSDILLTDESMCSSMMDDDQGDRFPFNTVSTGTGGSTVSGLTRDGS